MSIRAIIIEDEFNAREEMEFLINEIGGIQVLDKCANALEGIKAINLLHPDVIFLDVQLPVISGLEMLSMIEDSIMPRVIFVTAYDDYALDAFEADAVDYILKPVEKDRLIKAVSKIKNSIQQENEHDIKVPPLLRIPSAGNHKVKLVDIETIEFIHSNDTGIFFLCGDKKCYTDLSLKALEERTKLFRCHKQYLVNLNKIDEITFEENASGKIKSIGNHLIPVSRHYLKDLKEILGL